MNRVEVINYSHVVKAKTTTVREGRMRKGGAKVEKSSGENGKGRKRSRGGEEENVEREVNLRDFLSFLEI